MTLVHFRLIGTAILLCGLCAGGEPAAAGGAPLGNQSSPSPQSSKSKSPVQSKRQKVANPLNDLLDEAQRDIDKSNFEEAIAPLTKDIAEQPEFAYAHYQLSTDYPAFTHTESH